MSRRIAVSLRGEMRALAGQGIFATDCYSQLRQILLDRLGPEHASLLAEPQHNADNRSIDWYTDLEGEILQASELAPDAAAGLRKQAAGLALDIQDLAGLSGNGGPDQRAGQAGRLDSASLSSILLGLALKHPDSTDLWSVGGRPVLVNWGFGPASAGAEPQDLTRLGAIIQPVAPAPPPPVTPTAPVRPAAVPPAAGPGFWPWLLPLLLLLLLLWLLLSALGHLPSPLPESCKRHDDPVLLAAIDQERERAATLDQELAALWRRLLDRAAQCQPPAPKAQPQVVEPQIGESPVEKEPEPVKPKPKPKPEPRPEPPKPKPRKNDALKIPEDAAKKRDLSFLEGCWSSETGLFSSSTHEPITAEYCFDRNGKGRRFVRERNGQVCSGGANARFDGSQLRFESGMAHCPRGNSYVPQKVECTGRENTTQCMGIEQSPGRNRWNAGFTRK